MSGEDDKNTDDRASKNENMISLSQALLAPLDAIFKAQIHSARSFLNLLLQLGYRHQPLDKNGNKIPSKDAGKPYYLEFEHEVVNEDNTVRKQKISIPQLAAIPINPLSVESAEFHFAMDVRDTSQRHTQLQEKPQKDEDGEIDGDGREMFRKKRPWFLVEKPISMRGNIVAEDSNSAARSQISISVKVGPSKVPAGLNKFITSLGELAELHETPSAPASPEPDPRPTTIEIPQSKDNNPQG